MIIIWSLLLFIKFYFAYLDQFQLRLSLSCVNITQQQDSSCFGDHFDTVIKSDNIINKDKFLNSIKNSINKSKNWYLLDLTQACNNQITRTRVNEIIGRNEVNELVGFLQCSSSCSIQYQLNLANLTNINNFILIAEDCKNLIKKSQINNNQVILPLPDKLLFNEYWAKFINHTLQYNIDFNSNNFALINLSPYTSNSLPLILSIILACFIVFLILFICLLVGFRQKPNKKEKEEYTSVDIIDDYNNLYHDVDDGNSTTISLGDKELKSHYEINTNFQKGLEEEMNEVFEELSANSKNSDEFNKLYNASINEKPSVSTTDYNLNFNQLVSEEISNPSPSPESATIPKHFSFKSLRESSFGSPKKEIDLNFPRMVAKVDPIPPRPSSSSKPLQSNQLPYKNTRCSVCFLDYRYGEKVRSLTCGHTFHLECIDQWLIKFNTNRCPICYKNLKSNSLRRTGSIKDIRSSTNHNPSSQSLDIQPSTSRNAGKDIGLEITRSHTLRGSSIAEGHSYNSSTGSELSLPEPHLRKYHKLNKSQQSSINDK